MCYVVGGASTFMYVNVNTVANERYHAAPPCDILAFETVICAATKPFRSDFCGLCVEFRHLETVIINYSDYCYLIAIFIFSQLYKLLVICG